MRTLRRLVRPFAVTALAAFAGACYSYVPVERPAPGTTVRIRVPVTSAVQNPNRPPESFDVEGVVLTAGDSLVMVSETRRELSTFRVVSDVDTVRVARANLLSVEEQVFSKPRTFALTALVTGAAVGVVLLALDAAGGGEGPDGGGDPVTQGAVRIPFVLLKSLVGGIMR